MPKPSPKIVRIRRKRDHQSIEQTLNRLYSEHASALRAFLSVRLQSRHEVDDFLQDVFVRLARMDDLLEKLPESNGSARSYLFVIANRLVIDAQRHKQVRKQHARELAERAVDIDLSSSPSAESTLMGREDLEFVRKAINEMKPAWRTAFVLNRFRSHSYREVSEMMGVSQKTVEKYIHHALLKIRDAVSVTGSKAGGR